jgi:hypothetical protein
MSSWPRPIGMTRSGGRCHGARLPVPWLPRPGPTTPPPWRVGGMGRGTSARAEQQIVERFGAVPDFVIALFAPYADSCDDAKRYGADATGVHTMIDAVAEVQRSQPQITLLHAATASAGDPKVLARTPCPLRRWLCLQIAEGNTERCCNFFENPVPRHRHGRYVFKIIYCRPANACLVSKVRFREVFSLAESSDLAADFIFRGPGSEEVKRRGPRGDRWHFGGAYRSTE